ncbi:MAG: hypothetical protein OXC95_13230 [Dehalococcoidia bacterium]|nr:hypothetical protein [Dehalococcoidia bacterium]
MRRTMRMKQIATTKNTTAYRSLDEPTPMDDFNVNTKRMEAEGMGNANPIVVTISTEPLAAADFVLTPPPVPYHRLTSNFVRYQHRDLRDGRDRPVPNTIELPVTLAYANRTELPEEFIAERKPIYFGISKAMGATRPDYEVADETADLEVAAETSEHAAAEGIAGFDAFLTESVREEEGGRLTTRRVWRVWAEKWGADPDEQVIAGVRFDDVAGRVSEILGVTTAKDPTRVDGTSQRYWPGHAI